MSDANLEGWEVNRSECARQKQTGRGELPPKRGCQEEEAHLTGKQSKLREQQAALMKTDGSRQARRAHNQEASDCASLYLSRFVFFSFPLHNAVMS